MLLPIIMQTLDLIVTAVWWIVIAQFILYLLLAFNVVSMHNKVVESSWTFLSTILDPLLAPIRRHLPPINGMDFSYMVLLFGLRIVQWLLSTVYVATLPQRRIAIRRVWASASSNPR